MLNNVLRTLFIAAAVTTTFVVMNDACQAQCGGGLGAYGGSYYGGSQLGRHYRAGYGSYQRGPVGAYSSQYRSGFGYSVPTPIYRSGYGRSNVGGHSSIHSNSGLSRRRDGSLIRTGR